MGAKRLVVGISGASGAIYGIRLLAMLRQAGVETHLVVSKSAAITLQQEMGLSLAEAHSMADAHYSPGDVAASIASGSFKTDGMIIAPCSMKMLGEIASGVTATLISRAADVALKERRRLVLMARETPLTQVHLQNMLTITQMGGIIAPPVPAFYSQPKDMEEMVGHSLARVLDLFDIPVPSLKRWQGLKLYSA